MGWPAHMIGGSIMESSYSLNLLHMQTMVMMVIMEMMASKLWKKFCMRMLV
jgi:hypothetical protein